jgi:hypothetical protein
MCYAGQITEHFGPGVMRYVATIQIWTVLAEGLIPVHKTLRGARVPDISLLYGLGLGYKMHRPQGQVASTATRCRKIRATQPLASTVCLPFHLEFIPGVLG